MRVKKQRFAHGKKNNAKSKLGTWRRTWKCRVCMAMATCTALHVTLGAWRGKWLLANYMVAMWLVLGWMVMMVSSTSFAPSHCFHPPLRFPNKAGFICANYTLNSIVSRLWQPKCLWYYGVFFSVNIDEWYCTISSVACDTMEFGFSLLSTPLVWSTSFGLPGRCGICTNIQQLA